MNNGAAALDGVLTAYGRHMHLLSAICSEDTP